MQTNFRGRDFIGDLDFSKEEVETVLDVAWRRILDDERCDLRATPVTKVMTARPKSIQPDRLAAEAARVMEDFKIHALLVVDADHRLVGALNIHDLLRARVV